MADEPTTPSTKTCTACDRTLPVEGFHRNRASKDGLCARCRDCMIAADKERRESGRTPREDRLRKFDALKRETFLDLIADAQGRGAAARLVGINTRTVAREMKYDPQFAAAVSEAEMSLNERVENALFANAIGGNVTAQQVWLYNRAPDRWADKRWLEHRGIPAPIVASDGEFDPKKLSDEELRAFEALLAKGRVVKPSAPPKQADDTEGGTLH